MHLRVALGGSIACSLLAASNAIAHHSFAPHLDESKPVSIPGTVTEFEARNPHSYLHISAIDENGRTREYVCESHGVTQLSRAGVTPQVLKSGTKLRVTGSQSRHSPYMCFFDSVEFEDGRKLSVNSPAAAAQVAQAPRKDIFGTWLLAPIANRSTSGPQPMIQFLTPAGEKAVAAYDPFKDDPRSAAIRRDPPRLGRAVHAAGNHRSGSDVVLPRMDGRPAHRAHEHDSASKDGARRSATRSAISTARR